MVVSVHVGTITIPILLVRRLSLGPEAQPVSNNAQTPTGVHMAPKLGLFPHSLYRHTPTTEAPISRTLSCTPTPQVSHTPLRLPSHSHMHSHIHTHPQTDGFTLPSDTSPTHTHRPCGWAITPSHNSETCFALLRHRIQTQALHSEKIEAEQTASGSEKQMPTRSILSSSESPQLFP